MRYASLYWLSQENASKRAQESIRNRPDGGRKPAESEKRYYFDETNLPSLFKTKDLTFLSAENKLVFEFKKDQIKAKKVAKKRPFGGRRLL
jgi:hypothetical protein